MLILSSIYKTKRNIPIPLGQGKLSDPARTRCYWLRKIFVSMLDKLYFFHKFEISGDNFARGRGGILEEFLKYGPARRIGLQSTIYFSSSSFGRRKGTESILIVNYFFCGTTPETVLRNDERRSWRCVYFLAAKNSQGSLVVGFDCSTVDRLLHYYYFVTVLDDIRTVK